MKLYLDTSTHKTILKLDNHTYTWESNRDLARHLLKFIHDKLKLNHKDWHDLTELHFFTGPGSFTGLRIGATIINTLAQELKIPIFDQDGNELKIAIPKYGKPANITHPKK
jgi:tRNA threonylcarbamoyladenosine biosynthesis protein TsaB